MYDDEQLFPVTTFCAPGTLCYIRQHFERRLSPLCKWRRWDTEKLPDQVSQDPVVFTEIRKKGQKIQTAVQNRSSFFYCANTSLFPGTLHWIGTIINAKVHLLSLTVPYKASTNRHPRVLSRHCANNYLTCYQGLWSFGHIHVCASDMNSAYGNCFVNTQSSCFWSVIF